MCVASERPLYAVGSQSHVYLVDPRSKKTLSIMSKFRGAGTKLQHSILYALLLKRLCYHMYCKIIRNTIFWLFTDN